MTTYYVSTCAICGLIAAISDSPDNREWSAWYAGEHIDVRGDDHVVTFTLTTDLPIE